MNEIKVDNIVKANDLKDEDIKYINNNIKTSILSNNIKNYYTNIINNIK